MSKLRGHLLCECQNNFMRTRHQTTEVELREERGGLLYVTDWVVKKGMSVRPGPAIVVIEASRQIMSMLCLTSNGRETLQ